MSIQNDKPRMMFHSSSKSSMVNSDYHFLVRGPASRLGEGKEENQDDVPGTAHDGSTNDLLLSPLLCLSGNPFYVAVPSIFPVCD